MRLSTLLCGILFASSALAQSVPVRLQSDPTLVDSGLWTFVLPRFSLKHAQPVTLVAEGGEVQVSLSGERALFEDMSGQTYYLSLLSDGESAQAFYAWLLSDIGIRTIVSFSPDGTPLYSGLVEKTETEEVHDFPGDPELGHQLAQTHCGRCHVVDEANRFRGISSTPSFMALRTFEDWFEKYEVFWTLNPHPSFVQVEGVTPEFDPAFPPAIIPVMLTLDELDHIGAYLSQVEPADLGAPLEMR